MYVARTANQWRGKSIFSSADTTSHRKAQRPPTPRPNSSADRQIDPPTDPTGRNNNNNNSNNNNKNETRNQVEDGRPTRTAECYASVTRDGVCVCVCIDSGPTFFFCCAVFQVRRRPPTPVGRRAAAAHEYADASANGRGAVAVHNRWLRFSRNTKQNAFLKADTVIESLTLTSRYLLTHLSGLSCFVCFSSLDR